MSAILIGNSEGIIYQVEQPVHINPDGSAQATLAFKCSAAAGVVVIPEHMSSHPNYSELKCYESTLDYEPGGIQKVTSVYRGVWNNLDPEDLAQFEFSRTTCEAPIETHPRFALPFNNPPVTPTMLALIDLALQNSQDPVGLTPVATVLYNKKRRGIESYLKPGAVFKKVYVSDDYPDSSLMEMVGKIVELESPAPTPPPHQNYLCMGVSWTKTAGVVTITEEYQLSGPGGWDPDLYLEEDEEP